MLHPSLECCATTVAQRKGSGMSSNFILAAVDKPKPTSPTDVGSPW